MRNDRSIGYVPTPSWLVYWMARLLPTPTKALRVLEPGCANAPFLEAFAQLYGRRHTLVGVEIDSRWQRSLVCNEFYREDYLLWQPNGGFDVIIGNPPYGVIGKDTRYALGRFNAQKPHYKRLFSTWSGKYNIYGLFLEKSVRLLNHGGFLVMVVPATWLVLDDFRKLRELLVRSGRFDVFYLGKVFPKVPVSAVVLRFQKGGHGVMLHDHSDPENRDQSLLSLALDPQRIAHGDPIAFLTEEWRRFEASGIPLGDVFEVKFAARSPEFKRAAFVVPTPAEGLVPVLTGRNLKAGWIDYETCHSKLWMRLEDAPKLRSFYGSPHLVVAHTKGSRLVCAVDWRCYPWREEYHLVEKASFGYDLAALERYLNSDQINRYLREVYRDFSPHLTATMLRRAPIPEPKTMEA